MTLQHPIAPPTDIRVLIVDSHSTFRDALSSFVRSQPSFRVVAEACEHASLLPLLELYEPDILLLDFPTLDHATLPLLQFLAQRRASLAVILLAAPVVPLAHRLALDLGTSALIDKELVPQLLIPTILGVYSGQSSPPHAPSDPASRSAWTPEFCPPFHLTR